MVARSQGLLRFMLPVLSFGLTACLSPSGQAVPLPAIPSNNQAVPLVASPSYNVTWVGDGNEAVTPFASLNVISGETLSFQIQPHPNFTVSTTVGGTCPSGMWGPPPALVYTTGPLTGNCSVIFSSYSSMVTTFAGVAGQPGSTDGSSSSIQFNGPRGVAVDRNGNVYVSDTGNHTIRKITAFGQSTTIAGMVGQPGSADGIGTSAQFNSPVGLTVDSQGNVFVADWLNSTIRKITPNGEVSTFAGTAGKPGSEDGVGSSAQFALPRGITVDFANNLYVTDTGNNTIRKITPNGVVSTLAGSPNRPGAVDGLGSMARFFMPTGITVDILGNLYVSDTANYAIRMITPAGAVSTLAGSPGLAGISDGVGTSAQFGFPYGISIDGVGNFYVADGISNTIRKIERGAIVSTLAGMPGTGGTMDAPFGPQATFLNPEGVAVDASNNVYVADTNNHTIRKIQQQ